MNRDEAVGTYPSPSVNDAITDVWTSTDGESP